MALLLAFAALLILGRTVVAWRFDRDVSRRLPRGDDGVVRGAATIAFSPDAPAVADDSAVLLVHGFGDTPQSLEYVAAAFRERGLTVLAPLLPGHGRSLRDFARSTGDEWIAAVRAAYDELRARHHQVAIVGLSMGGALSAIVASEHSDIPALVLLAPYLNASAGPRRLARWRGLVTAVAPYITGGGGVRSIRDDAERARSLAFGVVTPRLMAELVRVSDRARSALPKITAPTLIVQSPDDNRIAPDVAREALAALGATERRLEWVPGCGHVITVDRAREHVIALATSWVIDHLSASARVDHPQSSTRGNGPVPR
jgi:carboxylesterase